MGEAKRRKNLDPNYGKPVDVKVVFWSALRTGESSSKVLEQIRTTVAKARPEQQECLRAELLLLSLISLYSAADETALSYAQWQTENDIFGNLATLPEEVVAAARARLDKWLAEQPLPADEPPGYPLNSDWWEITWWHGDEVYGTFGKFSDLQNFWDFDLESISFELLCEQAAQRGYVSVGDEDFGASACFLDDTHPSV
ncbi:MAG: hypothetical protein AAF921_19355 [Cyanobacteria bacterium P01_D01_bin.44]